MPVVPRTDQLRVHGVNLGRSGTRECQANAAAARRWRPLWIERPDGFHRVPHEAEPTRELRFDVRLPVGFIRDGETEGAVEGEGAGHVLSDHPNGFELWAHTCRVRNVGADRLERIGHLEGRDTPTMELERGTAERYVRHAFTQMLSVADRLGDKLVNQRPLGPDTNAVAALIVHSCEVTEFWLGHVGLGRASHRNRDAEFSTTATLAALHTRVDSTVRQASDDLVLIAAGKTQADRAGWQFLGDAGDETDGALVLHVLEELYQHLGHMELAADALVPRA